MIVMLAISFMLITNLSYVEIFTLLRVRSVKFVEGIRLHAANRPKAVPVAARPSRAAAPAKARQVKRPVYDDEDEEDEDDRYLPNRKQPVLLKKYLAGSQVPRVHRWKQILRMTIRVQL